MGRSGWLVVGVDPTAPWTQDEITWAFDGCDLIVRPPGTVAEKRTLPDVSVACDLDDDVTQVFGLIRRFLSALSWESRSSVEERAHLVAGGRMRHAGHTRYAMFYANPASRWPTASPPERTHRLAQALYREALTVNSVPYKFLGLFKILEVASSTGSGRKASIRRACVSLVTSSQRGQVQVNALKRLDELEKMDTKPEDWLYDSCRCAVAHAKRSPIMNPDDVADTLRLTADMWLMRAAAEHVMVEDMGL